MLTQPSISVCELYPTRRSSEALGRHTGVSNQHPATKYTFDGKLGSGNFGEVNLLTSVRDPTEQYACKSIVIEEALVGQVLADLDQLLSCSHRNLIEIADVMLYRDTLYLVSELVPSPSDDGNTRVSPDLYSWLLEETPIGLGEVSATASQIAMIVHQIALGIAYLNSRGMMHGNLRLENVLVGPAGISELKLTDFGMASITGSKSGMVWKSGGYTGPELLNSSGSEPTAKADIFALGVLMFVLFVKRPPFGFGNGANRAILSGKYSMDAQVWGGVSASAQKLVRSMLEADPNKRPAIQQVLSNGWIWSNGGK